MRIGIDLGGTKIEIAALGEDGEMLYRRRVPTPSEDYAAIVRAIVDLVAGAERSLGQIGTVGVGMPGSLSPATGLARNANTQCLNGEPFDRDLATALDRPVRLANDANCLALSEAIDGAGAGARVVFAVILGTGVGGGLALDGKVWAGANGIAGEWGHDPLPWPTADEVPGPRCWCGQDGCIERWLSGPGLVDDHAARTGEALATPEIVRRAAAGDARAEASLARYEQRLARALAAVVNLVDPDVVVLAGGLSNLDRLVTSVPRLWRRWIFADHVATRLSRARHGDSSGVRGAAWLWDEAGVSSRAGPAPRTG